jgi:hypothetical protein
VLEYTNGKTDDLQKMMATSFPCSLNIKYVFEPSGKHFMILPKDCISIPNVEANWKVSGNQLIINQKTGKEMLNTIYELTFSGNIMTMTHNYTEAEKASKTKRIILKYEKL